MKQGTFDNITKRQIKQVVSLALLVQNKTEHDVFIDTMPHIKSVGVKVCLGGWSDGVKYHILGDQYLGVRNLYHFNKTMAYLKGLLCKKKERNEHL